MVKHALVTTGESIDLIYNKNAPFVNHQLLQISSYSLQYCHKMHALMLQHIQLRMPFLLPVTALTEYWQGS